MPPAQDSIVRIDSLQTGDTQVLVPGDGTAGGGAAVEIDRLKEFPSVESVVAGAAVRTAVDLPHVRELLISPGARLPDAATLRHFTGLDTLYACPIHGSVRLELESLDASRLRKLAVNRWFTKSLAPLERMSGLTKLRLKLFKDSLDPVAKMRDLEYLHVGGPAKGWAKLRECTRLEEAHLIDVHIASLRRWNTWSRLRTLVLAGRGIASLDGLEECRGLAQLTLINLPMERLAPLRVLGELRTLELRMVKDEFDLASVALVRRLRSFVVHSSASDARMVRIPSLRPLRSAGQLEELVLMESVVEDGDLSTLAEMPVLRRVRLGQDIGADVESLRTARPDIELTYTPPPAGARDHIVNAGAVEIQMPHGGLTEWSIFQSLATDLRVETNYDAEARIRKEIRRRDPALAKRLDWDTEAGAVGIYAGSEADIRQTAAIVNDLIRGIIPE